MHMTDWPTAIKDLLEYCRDPRHDLNAGRELGPVLLPLEEPAATGSWNLADDWALTVAVAHVIRAQIVHFRSLEHSQIPVSDHADEHLRMLKHDTSATRRGGELKFWSVLWAYYICGLSHAEIAQACGWSTRLSQLRVKEAREGYLARKLAELAHARRQVDANRWIEDW